MRLRRGKLPTRLLVRCLRWSGARDRRVLVGPRCGEDAAVIAIGRHRLVLKSDPVTFTAADIGRYVVQVNANDVATMGAAPCWFQPTVLLPPGTRPGQVTAIFRDIHRTCRALAIAVTGGHTEVTDAVTRPVVAGDMQGLLVTRRLITSGGARPGDVVLLSKAAGLEGTAILATEQPRALARALPALVLRRARRLSRSPGISVVTDALLAARTKSPTHRACGWTSTSIAFPFCPRRNGCAVTSGSTRSGCSARAHSWRRCRPRTWRACSVRGTARGSTVRRSGASRGGVV